MTGGELFFGTIIGIVILVLIVSIITLVMTKINCKEMKNIQNVYTGKLANSDSSIKNAMNYLKLTNGIKSVNGENK